MTALGVVLAIIFVTIVVVVIWWRIGRLPAALARTRAEIGIHRTRRRLDLAEFKHEVRRDAARLRRELHHEMRHKGLPKLRDEGDFDADS